MLICELARYLNQVLSNYIPSLIFLHYRVPWQENVVDKDCFSRVTVDGTLWFGFYWLLISISSLQQEWDKSSSIIKYKAMEWLKMMALLFKHCDVKMLSFYLKLILNYHFNFSLLMFIYNISVVGCKWKINFVQLSHFIAAQNTNIFHFLFFFNSYVTIQM